MASRPGSGANVARRMSPELLRSNYARWCTPVNQGNKNQHYHQGKNPGYASPDEPKLPVSQKMSRPCVSAWGIDNRKQSAIKRDGEFLLAIAVVLRRVSLRVPVPVRLTAKDFRIAHAGLWAYYSLSFRMAISLIARQSGQWRPFALVFEQHQCFRQRSFGMANKQKATLLRRTLPRPTYDLSRRSCDRSCPI